MKVVRIPPNGWPKLTFDLSFLQTQWPYIYFNVPSIGGAQPMQLQLDLTPLQDFFDSAVFKSAAFFLIFLALLSFVWTILKAFGYLQDAQNDMDQKKYEDSHSWDDD